MSWSPGVLMSTLMLFALDHAALRKLSVLFKHPDICNLLPLFSWFWIPWVRLECPASLLPCKLHFVLRKHCHTFDMSPGTWLISLSTLFMHASLQVLTQVCSEPLEGGWGTWPIIWKLIFVFQLQWLWILLDTDLSCLVMSEVKTVLRDVWTVSDDSWTLGVLSS